MKNITLVFYKLAKLLIVLILSSPSCSLIDDAIAIQAFDYTSLGTAPDKLKFIAIGDTGKGNIGQYQVAQAMKDKCETHGCDFILLLGDNIYKSGVNSVNDPQFIRKFERPYKDLNMPFFIVLGNHDYGGNGSGYDESKVIHQIKYSQVSSKWHLPYHYYHFNIMHTSFFALDTNAQLINNSINQTQDIQNWISSSKAKWKIAFGHHPYISNGRHGNAGEYDGKHSNSTRSGTGNKKFTEEVICGKVDLFLSGHDHDKQWLATTCKGTQFAVSGAGASTRSLKGKNPTLFQNNKLGFLYISIDGNKLSAEFIDVDGNIEFKHIIQK